MSTSQLNSVGTEVSTGIYLTLWISLCFIDPSLLGFVAERMFCYFAISFPLGSRQEVFASRAAKPACFHRSADRFCNSGRKTCMSAHHFHQSAGPFTTLLFYYFISIGFKAGGFCISGRKTCMSAHHFLRSPGRFCIRAAKPACRPSIFTSRLDRTLFYSFTVSFPLSSRQEVFCILGRQVGPPSFLHVGPPILHVPPHPSISQWFFASRTANPACQLTFLHVGQTYPPKFPAQHVYKCVCVCIHIYVI